MNTVMLRFTELCSDYKEKDMQEYEEPKLQQLPSGVWQVSLKFPIVSYFIQMKYAVSNDQQIITNQIFSHKLV